MAIICSFFFQKEATEVRKMLLEEDKGHKIAEIG